MDRHAWQIEGVVRTSDSERPEEFVVVTTMEDMGAARAKARAALVYLAPDSDNVAIELRFCTYLGEIHDG